MEMILPASGYRRDGDDRRPLQPLKRAETINQARRTRCAIQLRVSWNGSNGKLVGPFEFRVQPLGRRSRRKLKLELALPQKWPPRKIQLEQVLKETRIRSRLQKFLVTKKAG